jgi:hypothetical protein
MRLQLDFAAQMLGHLFEGRDEIIADARARVIRSEGAERFSGSFFPLRWIGGGDILALCSALPLLASRTLNAFERHQNSAALLG